MKEKILLFLALILMLVLYRSADSVFDKVLYFIGILASGFGLFIER